MTKDQLSEEQKLANLLLKAGTDVQRMYRVQKDVLTAANPDMNVDSEYVEALQILDSLFLHQKNESFQRSLFRQMIQERNESITSFVARQKMQVKFCGYSNPVYMEKAIKDQVMEKVNSEEL